MSTVLIIDDDPSLLRVMSRTLAEAGLAVVEARNGVEGLEAVRSRHPTLIVLDIFMPEKDGLEAIREIRATDAGAKILAISGGGLSGPDGPAAHGTAPGCRRGAAQAVPAAGAAQCRQRAPRRQRTRRRLNATDPLSANCLPKTRDRRCWLSARTPYFRASMTDAAGDGYRRWTIRAGRFRRSSNRRPSAIPSTSMVACGRSCR